MERVAATRYFQQSLATPRVRVQHWVILWGEGLLLSQKGGQSYPQILKIATMASSCHGPTISATQKEMLKCFVLKSD